jgi:two-component system OmpR family sensor kinase
MGSRCIDTRSVVDEAAERFRAAHPQRDLGVRIDQALPALDADAVLVRRALDNLLDNAQKHSEPNSIVVLRAEQVTAGGALSVQDFGIGIAADDLAKVATPFCRTDRSRARRTGGIGLGLSLARRIAEAHGGALHIDIQLSVGTTVRIVFPRAPQT